MGNNARDTPARREEEIAFLAVERVLGVRVALADAGGALVPDGRWVADGRVSVVEVTSPPSGEVMRAIAEATREGRPFVEAGCTPAHLGRLAEHLTDLVTQTLARDVEKLARANADERHLFLLGRTAPDHEYFARPSEEFDDGYLPVDDLALPDGVTDVWFRGRAHAAPDKMSGFTVQVACFNRPWTPHNRGWPSPVSSSLHLRCCGWPSPPTWRGSRASRGSTPSPTCGAT